MKEIRRCPFCDSVFEFEGTNKTVQGSVAISTLVSIECDCGATWAISRPRAVKADARGD